MSELKRELAMHDQLANRTGVSYEAYDEDAFTEKVRAYDEINRLDSQKTSLLLEVKMQIKGGAEDIKKHKWFQGFDWEALVKREMTAPVVPQVANDSDTSNFDPYPDSLEEAPMPVLGQGKDPFLEF